MPRKMGIIPKFIVSDIPSSKELNQLLLLNSVVIKKSQLIYKYLLGSDA
jgi:hypothetical protein